MIYTVRIFTSDSNGLHAGEFISPVLSKLGECETLDTWLNRRVAAGASLVSISTAATATTVFATVTTVERGDVGPQEPATPGLYEPIR